MRHSISNLLVLVLLGTIGCPTYTPLEMKGELCKVLRLRGVEKWQPAFEVADDLTRRIPTEAEPFVWRANAARSMRGGSVEEALRLLLEAAVKFDDEPIIPFHLARYNCQLGNLVEARSWLHIAFEEAAKKNATREWKLKAMDDKDLEPLREEMRNSD